MTYNLTFLENATVTELINGINTDISFFPMLFLFEFLLITISGSYANSRRTGYTNVLQWATLGSLITTTSAVFVSLILDTSEYAMYLPTLIICISITLLLVLALFLSKDE